MLREVSRIMTPTRRLSTSLSLNSFITLIRLRKYGYTINKQFVRFLSPVTYTNNTSTYEKCIYSLRIFGKSNYNDWMRLYSF